MPWICVVMARSGRVPGHYRLHDYADDVSAFIVRTVGGPATIYGHSLGGIVALLVAAHAPELVRAVVVGDAPLTADTWIAGLQRDRRMLEGWRHLAGGRDRVGAVIAGLKEIPIHWPADAPLRSAREALGEDAPWFAGMADTLGRIRSRYAVGICYFSAPVECTGKVAEDAAIACTLNPYCWKLHCVFAGSRTELPPPRHGEVTLRTLWGA